MMLKIQNRKSETLREDCLIRLASLALSKIENGGFAMRFSRDLREFEKEMAAIGKPENYPMISPEWHDFASGDAVGLLLKNEGNVVGGVAARFLNLGSDSLAEHWHQSYRRLYPGSVDPVESRVSAAKTMRGRLVYEGELYLHPDWRGARVNLPAVSHYMHVLCALKWKPDWIYAFMRIEGLGCAPWYGWTHQHLAAQRWLRGVERRSDKECLVSVTYDELCERAEYLVQNSDQFPDELLSISGSNN